MFLVVKDINLVAIGTNKTQNYSSLKVYVSRSDPFPSKQNHDFFFDFGSDDVI